MAMPVKTVTRGGMAVVDVTASGSPFMGKAVTEAANGTPVTKVAKGGMAVVYISVATNGDRYPK